MSKLTVTSNSAPPTALRPAAEREGEGPALTKTGGPADDLTRPPDTSNSGSGVDGFDGLASIAKGGPMDAAAVRGLGSLEGASNLFTAGGSQADALGLPGAVGETFAGADPSLDFGLGAAEAGSWSSRVSDLMGAASNGPDGYGSMPGFGAAGSGDTDPLGASERPAVLREGPCPASAKSAAAGRTEREAHGRVLRA